MYFEIDYGKDYYALSIYIYLSIFSNYMFYIYHGP